MADITRPVGLVPSLGSLLPPANTKITGLLAGENIAAGDACYIASDGTIKRSNGTAVNAAAKFRGMALIPADSGEACTLINHVTIRYANAMVAGANLYVSATAGNIADAATTGGTAPIGFVVDAQRIYIQPSQY